MQGSVININSTLDYEKPLKFFKSRASEIKVLYEQTREFPS